MEESTQEANGEEEANLANELPRPRLQVTRAVIMVIHSSPLKSICILQKFSDGSVVQSRCHSQE